MRRLPGLAAALILCLSPAEPGAHAQDIPASLVRLPDGRRINLECAGRGEPTILLEGGYAATASAWWKVQPQLARRYRVCAYDRAGYGLSDQGPAPRDGAAVAADLDQALRAARIDGPFVVVGHSAGGLYVRLFADRRPRDVVGMVLVEPSIEHQDRRFAEWFGPGSGGIGGIRARPARCLAAAEAGTLPSDDPALRACMARPKPPQPSPGLASRMTAWRTQLSELDSLWASTSDQVAAGRASYGDMPLVVLTAGEAYASLPEPGRAQALRLWSGLHGEIAARSRRGQVIRVAGAGHMLMFDRPDAVIAAVDRVVAAARR